MGVDAQTDFSNWFEKGYYTTRLAYDARRAAAWKPISGYLQRWVKGTVVDIGCGHADFLRFISAKKKIGIDLVKTKTFPADAKFIKAPVWDVAKHVKNADVVFASNLFEHLDDAQLDASLESIEMALKSKGMLIILQPNFKYCYRDYFDDYTHKKIFTHISLVDLLCAHGFTITKVYPKFTPFSMKSRIPVASWIVWLYLRSPIKPMAGQMLVIAEKT